MTTNDASNAAGSLLCRGLGQRWSGPHSDYCYNSRTHSYPNHLPANFAHTFVPGLTPLVDTSPQCWTWFRPSALAAEKKTWSPDDGDSKKSRKIVGLSRLESRLSSIPHSERNGTRNAFSSQGHSWRPNRNDWLVRIPCWTYQVSRGHCEDMPTRRYGRKQRHTDEEAEGYGENPICCGLLVPLPCRMERWNDWPIVTPDTGSVSCVFIRLSRYVLYRLFVPRSTLQLYLWFLSLLVLQVASFS